MAAQNPTSGRRAAPIDLPADHNINRDQRDGLYELIRNHLGMVEDLSLALERSKDFDTARRLASEFAQDFRLLDDLGWGEHDHREAYVLTMPAHELELAVGRLLREAIGLLVESDADAEESRQEADRQRMHQLGYDACKEVLAELGLGGRS